MDMQQEVKLAQDTEEFFNAPESEAVRANQERTQSRFIRRVLVPLVLVVVGAVLGSSGALAIVQSNAADAPDWTVPACSVYKYTQHPDLPAYTRTDMCFTAHPDGSTSVFEGDAMWKAAY